MVDRLWLLDGDKGKTHAIHAADPDLGTDDGVWLAIRGNNRTYLFAFGTPSPEDSGSTSLTVNWSSPIPRDAPQIVLDPELLPPPQPAGQITKVVLSEETADRLFDIWEANEWVQAWRAMLDEPRNAWLVVGGPEHLENLREDVPDFALEPQSAETLWTGAKQMRPGDLVFFYFMSPVKEIHYVARVASYPFFSHEIEVEGGRAAPAQWWFAYGMVLSIDPIPLATARAAFDGHLILRGGASYVPRHAVRALLPSIHSQHADVLETGLVAVPIGDESLPSPDATDLVALRAIAAGALTLESKVEDHIVEPLLRLTLAATGLTWRRQHRIPDAGVVDFAVLRGDVVVAVIEVKLGVRLKAGTTVSPDFKQLARYSHALSVPGVLIDANRIFLCAPGALEASETHDRAVLQAQDLTTLLRHIEGL